MFELGGALAPAIPELAVGPWRPAARIAAPGIAPLGIAEFDATIGSEGGGDDSAAASASGAAPESLWRVEIAAGDAASLAAFVDGERSVACTHAALDDMLRRLDGALRGAASAATTTAGRASAATLRRTWPVAEANLLTALAGGDPVAATTRLASAPGAATDPALASWAVVSIPASSAATMDFAQEPSRVEQALRRIADLARGRARIETRVEGVLVAHSLMTLSGDTELWVGPRFSPASARLHARSVAVAARTRDAWARILTLVVIGGRRLLAIGATGGGVLALPLVWRFVRDVLREARALAARPRA